MNTLRNALRTWSIAPWLTRLNPHTRYQVNTTNERKLLLEPLHERHIIRVSGRDVSQFLQGLTTNDMRLLESPTVPAIYTMFLNKTGRVMCDAIVYKTPDNFNFLIECDKEISEMLMKHLTMYRVRRKIDIDDLSQEVKVWALFDKNGTVENITDLDNMDLQAIADPRLENLGLRLLTSSNLTHKEISDLCRSMGEVEMQTNSDYKYKQHRYCLGVAEGVADIEPHKHFPLEANVDLLNGVSFNKGCYIGQELTARVHHTGVIRKRHMPLQLENSLPMDSEKIIRNKEGTKVGTVMGNIGTRAIGLMRIQQVIGSKDLYIDDIKCSAQVPQWWPPEVLNTVSRRQAA